jgi:hypothetical protein
MRAVGGVEVDDLIRVDNHDPQIGGVHCLKIAAGSDAFFDQVQFSEIFNQFEVRTYSRRNSAVWVMVASCFHAGSRGR